MRNNIAFYITPKAEVEYLFDDFSVRQALEKMQFHRYAMIPVLEKGTGKYLYALSEGDILWTIHAGRLNYDDLGKIRISSISKSRNVAPASIDCDIESLYSIIINQNFVPIVDDRGLFIGIVTRKKVLASLLK